MMRRNSRRGMGYTAMALTAAGALVLGACGGDDGGGGGSAADWCTTARAFSESGDVLDDDEMDPGTIRDGMREAVRAVEQLERAAPAEIRDDVRQVAAGFKAFNDALAKVDYNFFALLTDPEAAAAIEALDTPDFEAASDRIDAYTLRECGFSLDDGDDDPFGDDPIGDDSMDDDSMDDDPFGSDDDDPFGDDDSFNFGDDEASIQMMAQIYAGMFGITQEQATCFAQQLFSAGQADFDPGAFDGDAPFLSACGLTPEDFSGPGG